MPLQQMLQGIPKPPPASAKPLFIAVFAKAKTGEARKGNWASIKGFQRRSLGQGIPKGVQI